MKTVLAPGAPWPKPPEPKPEKPPKVVKPPITATSKIKRTNDNFEAWRKRAKALDLSHL